VFPAHHLILSSAALVIGGGEKQIVQIVMNHLSKTASPKFLKTLSLALKEFHKRRIARQKQRKMT
jgi:hypothetical protein